MESVSPFCISVRFKCLQELNLILISKQSLSKTGLFLPQHLLRYAIENAVKHLPGYLWKLSEGGEGSGKVLNLGQSKQIF